MVYNTPYFDVAGSNVKILLATETSLEPESFGPLDLLKAVTNIFWDKDV